MLWVRWANAPNAYHLHNEIKHVNWVTAVTILLPRVGREMLDLTAGAVYRSL